MTRLEGDNGDQEENHPYTCVSPQAVGVAEEKSVRK